MFREGKNWWYIWRPAQACTFIKLVCYSDVSGVNVVLYLTSVI